MKKMPFGPWKLVALALVATSVFSSLARAESVKADPLAAKGCIARVPKDDAIEAMRRFHFHSFGGTNAEIRTLGTALTFIEKLNAGKPLKRASAKPDANYGVRYRDAFRNSHQAPNEIRINRNGHKRYGENVAQIVHEIGHYIGNNGGYEAYYDYMGHHYCRVSSYSDDNSHEQFAEVFAAFVTRPAFLKKSDSPTCKRAFKFFSTVIFPPTSAAIALKCMARQEAILHPAAAAKPAKAANGAATTEKPSETSAVKRAETPAADKPSTAMKPKKQVEFNLVESPSKKPATTDDM